MTIVNIVGILLLFLLLPFILTLSHIKYAVYIIQEKTFGKTIFNGVPMIC